MVLIYYCFLNHCAHNLHVCLGLSLKSEDRKHFCCFIYCCYCFDSFLYDDLFCYSWFYSPSLFYIQYSQILSGTDHERKTVNLLTHVLSLSVSLMCAFSKKRCHDYCVFPLKESEEEKTNWASFIHPVIQLWGLKDCRSVTRRQKWYEMQHLIKYKCHVFPSVKIFLSVLHANSSRLHQRKCFNRKCQRLAFLSNKNVTGKDSFHTKLTFAP